MAEHYHFYGDPEFWDLRKLRNSLPNEEHEEAFLVAARAALESADTDSPGWGSHEDV